MKQHPFALAPLLLPALALAAGIVAGCELLLTTAQALALLAAALVVTLLAVRRPRVQSAGLLACFLLLGVLVSPRPAVPWPDDSWTEAAVVSVPVEKPKTVMADLLLSPSGERRRCYIAKEGCRIGVGQNLMVCIRHGRYVGRSDWQPGGRAADRLSRVQRLRLRALQWRCQLVQRFQMGADADASAVLAAMVLGDKSSLTPQLRHTYARTGAAHILALSGLHLSIIYLLLTRLTQGRRRFWLTQVLVVLAVWAFALLTGLSPSVTRAATMLTVYALFGVGGRRRSPLGVLSFTAIVMLLCDSGALFDVGFQLSFMAMLAILLFCPLLEGFVSARWLASHPLARWLFGLFSVSVAAQLGVAPLVAYYFGQFPTWFLLTNLVVIPFATAILHGAVVVLLFPRLMEVLLGLVGLLNAVLGWLSRLPLATIGGLRPSVLQVVMLYVLVAVLYLLLRRTPAKPPPTSPRRGGY